MFEEVEVIEWVDENEDHPATPPVVGDAVVVLPQAIVEGRGRFPGSVNTLAKSLRDAGVDASYSHGADEREWTQLLGEAEVAFALAVAAEMLGSASWDVLRTALSGWLQGIPRPGQRITLDLRIDEGDRSSRLRLSGSGDRVIEALDRVPEVAGALRLASDDRHPPSDEDET